MKTSEIVSALESIKALAEKAETACYRGIGPVPIIADLRGEIDDLLHTLNASWLSEQNLAVLRKIQG